MKIRKNIKLIRYTVILFLLFGNTLFGSHPFYVSICEIDYKSETQSLELSMRIFTNDLEQTMLDWGSKKLYLGEEKEYPAADSILKNYIFQVFSIEIDEQKQELTYLGKEVELELTWLYFEVKEISDFDEIRIEDRLLIQSFPLQTNLIHVNHREKIKSLLLTKNNTSDKLTWD